MENNKTIRGKIVRCLTNPLNDYRCYLVDVDSSCKDSIPEKARVFEKGSSFWKVRVFGTNIEGAAYNDMIFHGEWKESSGYGMRFSVKWYEKLEPTIPNEVYHYLNDWCHLPPSWSEKFVRKHGMKSVDDLLASSKEEGIDSETLKKAQDIIKTDRAVNSVIKMLGDYGVEVLKAKEIVKKLGSNAVQQIRKNPYILTAKKCLPFGTVEKVAFSLGIKPDSVVRIAEGIKMVLGNSQNCGNLFVGPDELFKETARLLNKGFDTQPVNAETFKQGFIYAQKNKDIVFRRNQYVLTKSADEAEYKTAKLLRRFVDFDDPRRSEYPAALAKYMKENSTVRLSEKQQAAVLKALSSQIAVITGGPGTGKTTIAKALISTYLMVNGEDTPVTLMSPTGKASQRLSESTGMPAQTIHKSLGIGMSDGDAAPEARMKVRKGLLVIDESSMIDAFLMDSLMESIENSVKVIFVGDVNQLPSVGPGEVLRDMIVSGIVPTAKLTETFRQKGGSLIIDNALKINEGKTDLKYDGKTFAFVPVKSEQEALKAIVKLYKYEVSRLGVENVCILTPLRRNHTVSVEGLNTILQDTCNPAREGLPQAKVNGKVFRLNDRIIQMKNTDIASNGDIGVITEIKPARFGGAEFTIKFSDSRIYTYHTEDMNCVDLAYCMTIHKSQGSEYRSVIMPFLSSQVCPLFKRNLIYTGVTRAKETCILVGDKLAIDKSIKATESGTRNTLLKERMTANAK